MKNWQRIWVIRRWLEWQVPGIETHRNFACETLCWRLDGVQREIPISVLDEMFEGIYESIDAILRYFGR